MRITTLTLLFLLLLPCAGFAQANSSADFKKFGVGIGYSSNSVIGDSIRPLELSLRYRINDRHILQLYAPLSYKRSSIRDVDDTRKETLWGLGLGYDYTFYSHDHLDFFVGLSADYQWYQIRRDAYQKGPKYSASSDSYYEVEETYYYWNKVRGGIINPNMGIRLSFGNIASEIAINIPLSKLRKEAYSFRKVIEPAARSTYEGLYPDNKINELKFSTNVSANIVYYF